MDRSADYNERVPNKPVKMTDEIRKRQSKKFIWDVGEIRPIKASDVKPIPGAKYPD